MATNKKGGPRPPLHFLIVLLHNIFTLVYVDGVSFDFPVTAT